MVRYPMMTHGANVINPGLPTKYCLLLAVLVAAAGLGSLFLSEKQKKDELLEEVAILDNLLKNSLESTLVHKLKLAAKNAELEKKQLHLEMLKKEIKEMETKNEDLKLTLRANIVEKQAKGINAYSNDVAAKETRIDNNSDEDAKTKFKIIEPEKSSKTNRLPGPSLFDFFDAIVTGEFRDRYTEEIKRNSALKEYSLFEDEGTDDVYYDVMGDLNGNLLIVPHEEEKPRQEPDFMRLQQLQPPVEKNNIAVVEESIEEQERSNGNKGSDDIRDIFELSNDVEPDSNSYPVIIEIQYENNVEPGLLANPVINEIESDTNTQPKPPTAIFNEQAGGVIEIELIPPVLKTEVYKEVEPKSEEETKANSDLIKITNDLPNTIDINNMENDNTIKSSLKKETNDENNKHDEQNPFANDINLESKKSPNVDGIDNSKLQSKSSQEKNADETKKNSVDTLKKMENVLDFGLLLEELENQDENKINSEKVKTEEPKGSKEKQQSEKSEDKSQDSLNNEEQQPKDNDGKSQVDNQNKKQQSANNDEKIPGPKKNKEQQQQPNNNDDKDTDVPSDSIVEIVDAQENHIVDQKQNPQNANIVKESNNIKQVGSKTESKTGESNEKTDVESKVDASIEEPELQTNLEEQNYGNEVQVKSQKVYNIEESNKRVDIEPPIDVKSEELDTETKLESESQPKSKESDVKSEELDKETILESNSETKSKESVVKPAELDTETKLRPISEPKSKESNVKSEEFDKDTNFELNSKPKSKESDVKSEKVDTETIVESNSEPKTKQSDNDAKLISKTVPKKEESIKDAHVEPKTDTHLEVESKLELNSKNSLSEGQPEARTVFKKDDSTAEVDLKPNTGVSTEESNDEMKLESKSERNTKEQASVLQGP